MRIYKGKWLGLLLSLLLTPFTIQIAAASEIAPSEKEAVNKEVGVASVYASGFITDTELEKLRTHGPAELERLERAGRDHWNTIASLQLSDATRIRLTKRREIFQVLSASARRDFALNQKDSLLSARQTLRCLALLVEYFNDECVLARRVSPIKNFRITDFGAIGDGRHDDGPAFRRAVAQIRKENVPAVLTIPAGRYRFASAGKIPADTPMRIVTTGGNLRSSYRFSDVHWPVCDVQNLIVQGEPGTELIFADAGKSGILLARCLAVEIRNLKLRYESALFSQNTILSVDAASNSLVVRPDPGFPPPKNAGSCCQTHRPDGDRRIINSASGKFISQVTPLGDGTYRISIGRAFSPTKTFGLEPGLTFIIPFRVNGITSFRVHESAYCTVDMVEVVNSPAVAFSYSKSKAGNFIRCRVSPDSGAALSTNADGLHCNGGIGVGPYVAGCFFRNMGDDSFNIYNKGYHIASSGKNTITAMGPFYSGGTMLVVNPDDGLFKTEFNVVTAALSQYQKRRAWTASTNTILPDTILSYDSMGINPYSDQAIMAQNHGAIKLKAEPDVVFPNGGDGVATVLSDNDFGYNRNNGIVIQCSGVLVENNTLQGVVHAIRVGAFLSWKEGPPPGDILIRGNRINDCVTFVNGSYQLRDRFRNARSRPLRNLCISGNAIRNVVNIAMLDNLWNPAFSGNDIRTGNYTPKLLFNNSGKITLKDNLIDGLPLTRENVRLSGGSEGEIEFKNQKETIR